MTIALLFPGQGSQFIGMGKDFYDQYESAKSVYNELDLALNRPLSDLIFNGSDIDISLTTNSQPAIMATSIAIFRTIQAEKLTDTNNIKMVAGHSLGEYSSLVANESLEFSDAAKLLKIRSEAMQDSMPVGTGGMAALIGASLEQIDGILPELNEHGKIFIANDNANSQVVLSGEISAIDYICDNSKKYNIKRAIKLPVSAPFHCELINSAAIALKKEVVNFHFKDFKYPLVSNVNAKPCSAENIQSLLVDQVVSRVRWREILEYMVNQNTTTFIEIGPGNVLTNLVKRMSKSANAISISKIEDLSKLKEI
ncbi:ACP S-malonyltransferase [Pelagibacteraceae bacterium]|jgi:[acyl-carrier-protein] S-malonyltransferase|nr:ACP S-malonyltransferase [Pelagibacteraceae bacterium]